MKSRLDYRTKRIVIIAIIAVILFAIASISTFFFIKGNDKTQAAELDSMTASEQKNTQEQKNEEGTTQTTVPSGDTQSEQTSEEQTNDTTEVATTQTTPAMQIENDGTNGTQTTNANVGLQENTTTRTETQLVENKTVLLGFNQEDINVDINAVSNLSSNLPQIDKEITASNLNGILSGAEITYEIKITNQNAEIVNQLNVSALIPEGTELVADSISDNGICENGKISWKVDVNTEKTVKFTVKVIAEEGVISANAVVEGKETETIQTPILKATLTVDKTEVSKNETLIYTVSVENTANIPAEIKVEATIPENTQLETEGLDVTDKTINWNKTLEALEKVEYSYTVKVNKYEKDYVIENVVKVNEAETNKVSTTIVDKIPPQITVKDGYIGDKDRNIFSNVSFKLYDENGVVAYKINDGEYTTFTVNNWSDANFNNIKSRLVYGKNTITLKDVAGNETTYEFVYDNKAPTITVVDGYVGDKDRNIFSNVSFKLYDEYGVVAYKINDGEYTTFTVNNWSDANFNNIKSRLVYGKNTITLKDVAGNETTYEFVYDNKAPTITVVDGYIGDKDRNIFSNVSFKLYDEYGVVAYKINDGEYTTFTVNNWSDANFNNIKSRLVYGKNTITLKDVAGNETTYEFVYDNKAPTITVVDGYVGDKDRNIFSNVSFKLYDEYGVVAYKINDGEYTTFTVNNWSDANFNNIKSRLVYGKNTITLKDVAGNEATYEFVYDNKAPTITVVNGYVGDKDRNIFSNVSFKLYDEYGVVAYKINDGEYTTFTVSNWSDANFNNIKSRLVYGKNTITLKDIAGNEATYEFVYDNKAPSYNYVGIMNIDQTTEGYAKVGDRIWVYVVIDEHLSQEPEIKINGVKAKIVQTEDGANFNDTWYKYVGEVIMTEEMAEGEILFTINGYKDFAGNEGVELTNANINKGIEKILLDKTAPEIVKIQVWNKDNTSSSYIRNGETARVLVTFNEGLGTIPTLTIGNDTVDFTKTAGGNGEVIYSADIKIADDESTIPEGILPFTIKEYADQAGNAGNEVNESNTLKTLIYDRTAPVISIDKNVTIEYGSEFVDDIRERISDNITEAKDLKVEIYPVDEIEVDTNKLGTYKINYKITDKAGNYTVETRIVNIVDTIAPTAEVSFSTTEPTNKLFVTLKFSEKIDETTLPQGFYPVAGQENTYSKAYYSNKEHTVTFKDMAGNEGSVTFTITNIDSVAPTATVTFSNNNGNQLTNQDVTVTLTANESIKDMGDGWIRVDDKTFTKIYSENGKYSVEIEDKAGNKSIIKYEVKRIDKVAPEATATFSNNNGAALTQEDVTVTLTANESIKDIGDGWTRVDDKTFTKVYSENGKYSVEIEDKAGNKNTINYEVKRIDREAPEATVTFSNNNGAELTNQDVIVTLTANETIRDIEGWNRVNDRTFTKVYSENGKHDLEIVDKIGNKNTIHFEVKRIDKIAPTAQITISEDSESGKIIATLTADESIKDIGDEWVRSTDKVFTKEVEYGDRLSVNIQDKAGNTNTINYEVNE